MLWTIDESTYLDPAMFHPLVSPLSLAEGPSVSDAPPSFKQFNKYANYGATLQLLTEFRIRSDPYHLAGPGSTSGNVGPEPVRVAKKSTKIIKI